MILLSMQLSVNIWLFLKSLSLICSSPIILVGTELLCHICLIRFCIGFSFCCINKQLVDSLEQNICCSKTRFKPTNSWTLSGLRENRNSTLDICSRRFYVHAQTSVFSKHAPWNLWKVHEGVRLGGLGMLNISSMPFHFKPRGIKKYFIPYMV